MTKKIIKIQGGGLNPNFFPQSGCQSWQEKELFITAPTEMSYTCELTADRADVVLTHICSTSRPIP